MKKFAVGILGATGVVGQNYIHLLQDHPWFEVTHLAASSRSAGVSYAEAIQGRWHLSDPISPRLRSLKVHPLDAIQEAQKSCDFVFSALSGPETKEWEERYANAGFPVVSNASAHRFTEDVPMLIPEVNPDHLEIIPEQQKAHRWDRGFIVVKPNCSLQSYLTPLAALHRHYRLHSVIVSTLQALSGAGHPGVPSIDIVDNVIPFISGEEEKSEKEPCKIMGTIMAGKFKNSEDFSIAAHCNRVPVSDGHLACVSVKFKKPPKIEDVIHIWQEFKGVPQELSLPSAPHQAIRYMEDVDRPQPRLDRNFDKGMAVSVGRLRLCPVFDIRFVGLSHNTIRGAAGGGILNAELLVAKGWISKN